MNIILEHTKLGETDAWLLGGGKPLIVIHGGPGLDHTYLVDYLAPLKSCRKIVFYDQLDVERRNVLAHALDAKTLVLQFTDIVQEVGKGEIVDVLAHSWGAYIFYEALHRCRDMKIGQAILVSPVGLNRKRFDGSGERLIARIPNNMLERITEMEAEGKGVEIMNLIAPFYCGDRGRNTNLIFSYYSLSTYSKIMETLGNFDCRDVVGLLPKKTNLIYGERDIELPEDTKELQNSAKVAIISGAGHFSFAEKPAEFLALAQQILDV